MKLKNLLRTACAALLCLPLSGCMISTNVEVTSDLLLNGTVNTSFARPDQANAEGETPKKVTSCANFAHNFNEHQKSSQMQPQGRLDLTVTADNSTETEIVCEFSFRNWDPNTNRRVLWQTGSAYIFDTTEPVKNLFSAAPDDLQLTTKLSMPKEITKAPGGKISGATVTYDSLESLRGSHQIVAGDPEDKSLWEQYSLIFILLAALPLSAVVFVGMRKGKIEDEDAAEGENPAKGRKTRG